VNSVTVRVSRIQEFTAAYIILLLPAYNYYTVFVMYRSLIISEVLFTKVK